MKKILYILILLNIANLSAQKDTLYFNSAWNKTTKSKAIYFRPMPLEKDGNLFKIKEYYINGVLKMEGFWSNDTKEIFEGKATWYYKNGQIFQTCEYKKGELHGESTYYTQEGHLRAIGNYKNGKPWSGTFKKLFLSNIITEYLEGEKQAYLTFYKGLKQLARKEFFVNNYISKIQYFDKTGKNLGEISYSDSEAKDGQFIYYHMDDQKNEAITHSKIIPYSNALREGETIAFNINGKQISKGIYKNDKPWNGSFYNNYNYESKLINYKDGIVHGITISYDANGKVLKQQNFKNAKLDDIIISGELCEDLFVKTYQNGNLVSISEFEDETGKVLKKKTLYENKLKTKSTSYVKDKTFEINYKDDEPLNGVEYLSSTRGITTYKNGKKNGPFKNNITSSYYVNVSGTYSNDNFDGPIQFFDSKRNKKTKCIYANGLPIDGTAMLNSFITNYKKGKKQGFETTLNRDEINCKHYDSIARNYKKDSLDGDISFYKKSKLVAKGFYMNGKPFNGTIFLDETKKNSYSNGALLTTIKLFKHHEYQKKTNYITNSKDKYGSEVLSLKGKIISSGELKNNQAYNGRFSYFDNEKYPYTLTIVSYNKGKKDGLKEVYNISDNSLKHKINYKKDIPINSLWSFPFKDKININGIYKRGKPFSGSFYKENDLIASLTSYAKGVKKGYQYYATKNSKMQNLLDSIYYLNGKPFKGNKLEVIESRTLQHVFEKGKKVKTNIYYFGIAKVPNTTVTYTEKGFKTATKTRTGLEDYNIVTFNNTSKNNGKVIFLRGTGKGTLQFEDGKIIGYEFHNENTSKKMQFYSGQKNKFILEIKDSLNTIKLHSEFKIQQPITYNTFLNAFTLLTNNEAVFYCFIDNNAQAISSFNIKDGKPLNGINVQQTAKGVYGFKKYKNGETIKKQTSLTKEKLMKLLKLE